MSAESVRFVQITNSWPHHNIRFDPSLEQPLCLSSSPTQASGPSVWFALHNLRSEPMTLHTRHGVGTIEAMEVMEHVEAAAGDAPLSIGELVPSHLPEVQQCQLMQMVKTLSKPLCSSTQSGHGAHL